MSDEAVVYEPKPVDRQTNAALRAVSKPFEAALEDLDAKRGWNMSVVWKECVRLHDDNALLRHNISQMQVLLQDKGVEWASLKDKVSEYIDRLSVGDDDYLEKLESAQKIMNDAVKIMGTVNKTIVEMKREVRATEFQSKYYFHVNLVQQFMAGMTGILFKHLQSTDKLDAVLNDMRQLGKVFAFANPNQKDEDGE